MQRSRSTRSKLAAILLAAFASATCNSTSGQPQRILEPTAEASVIEVPTDVATPEKPVVYFRDPANQNRLLSYTWGGKLAGVVVIDSSEGFDAKPSVDGTRLLVYGGTLKSGGFVVAQEPRGIWGDDASHLCMFADDQGQYAVYAETGVTRQPKNEAWLYEIELGKPLRRVTKFGSYGLHSFPVVLACSSASQRAIVAEQSFGALHDIRVIDLKTGSVTYTLNHAKDPQTASDAVASADSRYIASGNSLRFWNTSSANEFVVTDARSGLDVGRVTGSGIVAFSADGQLALTARSAGGEHVCFEIVNWQSGEVLWTGNGGPGTVWSSPVDAAFMVGFRQYIPSKDRTNGLEPREDVTVIHVDGSSSVILRNVIPLA